MSGGPKKQQVATVTQAPAVQVPAQTDFSQYTPQGVGPTQVNQTFTAQGKPAWMTGVWDMPTWGKGAAMGGELTNQNLSAPAYTPPPSPQQQQQAPQNPFTTPAMTMYQRYMMTKYNQSVPTQGMNPYNFGNFGGPPQ